MNDVTIIIESTSAEPVDVDVVADADPTAEPPEFAITVASATSPGSTWVAGSWRSAWNDAGELTARSPTIGAAGALATPEGSSYLLWIRWGTVVKCGPVIVVN